MEKTALGEYRVAIQKAVIGIPKATGWWVPIHLILGIQDIGKHSVTKIYFMD